MRVMRPLNIPRFLPGFKQKFALTGQVPRKALTPPTCNYLLSYETDSWAKGNQKLARGVASDGKIALSPVDNLAFVAPQKGESTGHSLASAGAPGSLHSKRPDTRLVVQTGLNGGRTSTNCGCQAAAAHGSHRRVAGSPGGNVADIKARTIG